MMPPPECLLSFIERPSRKYRHATISPSFSADDERLLSHAIRRFDNMPRQRREA